MKHRLMSLAALVLAMLMLVAAASAETISLSGTVTARETWEVYAPIGGSVEEVCARVGQQVTADDVLLRLRTNKVYATEDGTVTGVFGQPGDDATTVSGRYGAVMYIEGTDQYTIAASTANAYNATENKYVHVGETVYLASRSSSTHTGSGLITAVSGTSFTVEVTSGTFESGESCDVFRSAGMETTSRIGRGTTARINPVAVTGSGSIVSFAVKNGDQVKRGQLLFETLDGAFDGLYMSGTDIYAGVDGVVASISASAGGSVQKDSVTAVIYPAGAMQLEASVSEGDLSLIQVGDPVEIEMNWDPDAGSTLKGTVRMISAVAESGDDSVSYTVYVDFTPDSTTRYGMSAVISTLEREQHVETEVQEEADGE